MKVLLLLLAGLCLAQALSLSEQIFQEEWLGFKLKHQKSYDTEEEELHRMRVYADNRDYIAEHNEKYRKGYSTYFMAENEFSDMTASEFQEIMASGYNQSLAELEEYADESLFFEPDLSIPLSEQKDWRRQGAVTSVKNQGHCGSCWSFSATGALEGQHYIHKHRRVSLSEQNLVDCTRRYGNNGCHGGLMMASFRYIKENHGIDTEGSYPYLARDNQPCHFSRRNVGSSDDGYKRIRPGSERDLLHSVNQVGPTSVAIDAHHRSFQSYGGGVYYEPQCSTGRLTHAILAIGYGEERRNKYWLMKNSWGSGWGSRGFIKMSRDRGNNCGVATQASFPVVH